MESHRRNCRKQIHGSLLKLTRDGDQSVSSSIRSPLTRGRKHYGKDMVWVDVNSRERYAASKGVLWAATPLLFAALQFKLSPICPIAADEMKRIHKRWRYFWKASMDPLVKDGLRMRYETSMQLLKSITCSSWACRGSTELRRRTCGPHTFRSGLYLIVNRNFKGG